MKYETTVENAALMAALEDLQPGPQKRGIPAIWRCEPEMIALEWGGMSSTIAVRSKGRAVFRISGGSMLGMARCPLDQDELVVRVLSGVLHVGRRRITCHEVTTTLPPLLLPVGGDDVEFLKLYLQQPAAVIVQSGLRAAVDERVGRVEKALDEMGRALAWTGLSRERLSGLVWSELDRIHRCEERSGDAPSKQENPLASPTQTSLVGNTDLPLLSLGESEKSQH